MSVAPSMNWLKPSATAAAPIPASAPIQLGTGCGDRAASGAGAVMSETMSQERIGTANGSREAH